MLFLGLLRCRLVLFGPRMNAAENCQPLMHRLIVSGSAFLLKGYHPWCSIGVLVNAEVAILWVPAFMILPYVLHL